MLLDFSVACHSHMDIIQLYEGHVRLGQTLTGSKYCIMSTETQQDIQRLLK